MWRTLKKLRTSTKQQELNTTITYKDFLTQLSSLNLNVDDPLWVDCIRIMAENQNISTSFLSRKLAIGYARAARMIDMLENLKLISEKRGSISQEVYYHDYAVILNQIQSYKEFTQPKKENKPSTRLSLCDIKDGIHFEFFCANLLLCSGFQSAEVTQASNDYGVDIVAVKDGIRYAIQCKYYSNSVGNTAIQEIYAGKEYYDCHVAAVITNSYFTKNAIELAKKNKVILWDGEYLKKLSSAGNSENTYKDF
ncbi:restriction endonuclease [[Clostridium] innocuum]|nr:restriction endonuclease [[Clostridium] innocuum]